MNDSDDPTARKTSRSQQMVVIVETTTPEETMLLMDALRSGGVEAFSQEIREAGALPDFMQPQGFQMSLGRRLLVHADDVPVAEEVVRKATLEIRRKAVRRAFDPDLLNEMMDDPQADMELYEQEDLRRVDPAVRDEKLNERIGDWLAAGLSEVKIAQRLAAAGLSFKEARERVTSVLRERKAELEQARERRRANGGFLVALGAIALGCAAIMILLSISSVSTATGYDRIVFQRLMLLFLLGGCGLCCTGAIIRASASAERPHDLKILIEEGEDESKQAPGDHQV